MLLAQVVGTVVSTKKIEALNTATMFMVRVLGEQLKPTSTYLVCVDSVGAGLHEIVLVTQGSSARQTPQTQNKPVDGVIVGIVDQIEIEGLVHYDKSVNSHS